MICVPDGFVPADILMPPSHHWRIEKMLIYIAGVMAEAEMLRKMYEATADG